MFRRRGRRFRHPVAPRAALAGALFGLIAAGFAAAVWAEDPEDQSRPAVTLPQRVMTVPGLLRTPDISVESVILRRAFPDHPVGPPPREEAPQPGEAPAGQPQQSGHVGFCETVDLTGVISGVTNVAAQDNGICTNADIDTYVSGPNTYVVQAGGEWIAWTHTKVDGPAGPSASDPSANPANLAVVGQFCWSDGFGGCDDSTYTPDIKAFHQGGSDYIAMGLERLSLFGGCGVVIVNVDDPANPVFESQFIGTNWCDTHNVFVEKDPVSGDGLYVYATADATDDMRVLDISGTVNASSSVSNPVEIGRYKAPTANSNNYVHDVTVINHGGAVGRRVYLAYWDSGLVILDAAGVTPGTNPAPIVGPNVIDPAGFANHHSFASADGSLVFIQDEFLNSNGNEPVQMWDVSNPASPAYVDGIVLGTDVPANPAHNLEIRDDIHPDRLYVGWYKLGLQAWDFDSSGFLAGPGSPPRTAVLYHQVETDASDGQYDGAWGVRLAEIGGEVYIFQSDRGYGLIVDRVDSGAGGNNTAPVAVDDGYAINEDTALVVAAPGVLGNDTDADADPLTASVVSGPTNGVLNYFNSDGSFSYTPNADFDDTDTFTYRASDGNGGTDTALVTITVSPVNDAPVAQDDSYMTPKNTTLNVAAPGVLGNDTDVDGDALTAVLVNPPLNAFSFNLNGDGSFSYTPTDGFTGDASFTYKPNDGTVDGNVATVTINVKKGKGGGGNGGGNGDKPCNPNSPKC